MPVKHARHIALSAPLAAWVDDLVAREEYTSASDLVRTALRQMQERRANEAGVPAKKPTGHPAYPAPDSRA